MKTDLHYIMNEQKKCTIDDIMHYDLTWRQKTSNRSLHLSIVVGLMTVSFISQII